MQKRVFAGMAALTLGLSACGTGYAPVAMGPGITSGSQMNLFKAPRRSGEAAWTVFVHMACDNNLYRFGLEDLNEAEAAFGGGDDVNVIVLFDGARNGDSAVYKVKRDPNGMHSTIVSEKIDNPITASGEIDSGSAKVNADFLAWGVKKFPAQKYASFFWDHGSGIFSLKNRSLVTKGFGWDDNGTHMSTRDINTVLGAGVQAAGKPFEIYGFDACLMAHTELAYQAKGLSNYLVASEELEPGAGWDYRAWVGPLTKNPAMNGAQLGKTMVDGFLASYRPGGSQNPGGRRVDATLSTVHIPSVAGNLTGALNNFASWLANDYDANKATHDELRRRTVTFDNTDCADLGDFLKHVKASNLPANIKAGAVEVEKHLDRAVVANGGIGSPTMEKATGLVIYFPRVDQAYNPTYSDPNKIAFGAENWKSYLLKTHGKSARR